MYSWAEVRTLGTESGEQHQSQREGRRNRHFTSVNKCKHTCFSLIPSLATCPHFATRHSLACKHFARSALSRPCVQVLCLICNLCVTSLPVKTTCDDTRRPFLLCCLICTSYHTSPHTFTATSHPGVDVRILSHPHNTHPHPHRHHVPDSTSATLHFQTQITTQPTLIRYAAHARAQYHKYSNHFSSMDPKNELTEREKQLMALAWLCFSDKPKVRTSTLLTLFEGENIN
jgi:hypothetical protein